MADKKFCQECGEKINPKAEICPKCGVRVSGSVVVNNYSSSGGHRDKTVAILLAVFLWFWTWLYTYKKDAWKFWVGLGSCILLFWTFIVPMGIWVWAIIDTVTKSKEFYDNY